MHLSICVVLTLGDCDCFGLASLIGHLLQQPIKMTSEEDHKFSSSILNFELAAV